MRRTQSRDFKEYYDRDSDIKSLVFKSGEEDEYIEIAPGVNLEFDVIGDLIGIEIFDYSQRFIKGFSLENKTIHVDEIESQLISDSTKNISVRQTSTARIISL